MSARCLAETCAHWTGHGCACAVMDVEPECVPCLTGDSCPDHDPAGDTTEETEEDPDEDEPAPARDAPRRD
jgi:hypothetical protein